MFVLFSFVVAIAAMFRLAEADEAISVEVRVVARSTDSDRIEFAIQQRLPDGSWSEYKFGRARFFGPDLHDGRWKHATPVQVELVEISAGDSSVIDNWYPSLMPGSQRYCSEPGTNAPRSVYIYSPARQEQDGTYADCLVEGGLIFASGPSVRGQMNIFVDVMPEPGHRRVGSRMEREACGDSAVAKWKLNGNLLNATQHKSNPYSYSRVFDIRSWDNVTFLKDGINTLTVTTCQVRYHEYRGYRVGEASVAITRATTFRLDFELLGWDE